ncbi:Uncharacterized protein OBRU01_23040 [Operophtera brumata]|uniref:Uncharacterized protein n=1 Tax=Operophtera brumata TaxID=104452 RepID=A0A0L7K594_OPEBR|nr:Uncharacterized protein OBRU01_23040 [Operophtera brumata]
MLSKLLQPCRFHVVKLLALKAPQKQCIRTVWGIPASQYDIPISNKFKMGYVDVVFSTNSRANISRTMNLRYPTVHKVVIINQRYEPWPEMQDVLDKMITAEKRALVRMQSCNTTSKTKRSSLFSSGKGVEIGVPPNIINPLGWGAFSHTTAPTAAD